MRKLLRPLIVSGIFLLAISCRKEAATEPLAVQQAPDSPAELFFSNIARLVEATDIEGRDADFYLANGDDYPVLAKLAAQEIVLPGGSAVSYFDLPADQKPAFLQAFFRVQAGLLADKIGRAPALGQYISAQNEVVADALGGHATKGGELRIDDPVSFYRDLSGRIGEMALEFVPDVPETRTDYVWEEVDYSAVRKALDGNAKRGDIIVALPVHDKPLLVFDPFREVGKVGHAEVVTADVTASTTDDEPISIGARRPEGIIYNYLPGWRRKSYLCGICTFRIEWIWDGKHGEVRMTQTPFPDPAPVATWAEKYAGHGYLYWYEHLTAKWVAPERFTCTTLIWWCAEKACDVRISAWLSTLILPIDLLVDSNTYFKSVIE